MRRVLRSLIGAIAAAGVVQSPAAANDLFQVRPPEVGEAGRPGEMRRIIQPFGAWTRVCDENLRSRRQVCNISQSFLDGSGAVAFSWSLAGTQDGAPVMILRMPREGRDARFVSVAFAGEREPAGVALATCAGEVCLGYLPVDARLAGRLRAGGSAAVELLHEGRFRTLEAPLAGLAQALTGLR